MTACQTVNKPFVDSPEMAALKDSLIGYMGTNQYWKGQFTVNYTDGIKAMWEKANAYWLITDLSIVSRSKFPRVPFQIWTLRVKDMVGELTLREDTNAPVLYRQRYDYTDFPEGAFKMYLVDGVLMLPSEY